MRQHVIDALRRAGLATPNVESQVARNLDENIRDWIVLAYVSKIANQLRGRRPRNIDWRQGWLALPEYEHIPAEAADDSLEQLRARIARLEKQIRGYDYVRRAQEKLREDKNQLRAMKRLEVTISPYFVGDPTMTVTRAVLLHQQHLATPAAEQRRKAAKSATKARIGR